MLQRTQLMIDEQTRYELEYLSQVKGISVSSLVRELLKKQIQKEKKKQKLPARKAGVGILLKMAEQAEELDEKYGYEGPSDWSVNHDHYLYGIRRKK